jgi:ribosomal protein S18 acetylase RimI-like enzyme
MLTIMSYTGQLPADFAALGQAPYAQLPYGPADEEPLAERLCQQLAHEFAIIFYTAPGLRLAGLFPKAAGSEAAYFGFWETADDLQLNEAAFYALTAEASRRGLHRVVGPLHFSTYFRYRLRLGAAAPSWQQFDREPVNPPYYPALLEQLGFQPTLTFESRRLGADAVALVYRQQQAALAQLATLPFDFIPLNAEAWAALENEVFELIREVFGLNPAYRAVSRSQFNLLYNAEYAAGLCPHSSVLFRHRPTGRLAAISLCQPNYFPLQLPHAEAPDFQRHYPQLTHRTLLAKTVGVHPGFRAQGLQALLAAYAMQSFREYYDDIIFCLMRSDNLSLRFSEGLPMEVARYALFEKQVEK